MNIGALDKFECDELYAFCRQYPEKKRKAALMLGPRSVCSVTEYRDASGMIAGALLPRGNGVSNPVEAAALKRIKLLADCDMIERTARKTDGGRWYQMLIRHMCYGEGYESLLARLPAEYVPSYNRNAFFRAKREFYIRLKEERDN